MSGDLRYKCCPFTKRSVCVLSMRIGGEGKVLGGWSVTQRTKELNNCISGTAFKVLLDGTKDQAICQDW